ncbi:MAG: hypothetical protein R3Y22_08535 [Bacteroidales bacterium]
MKKLNYKTPEIEVVNIEIEGAIMGASLFKNMESNPTSSTTIIKSIPNSSYSMDDYNWK